MELRVGERWVVVVEWGEERRRKDMVKGERSEGVKDHSLRLRFISSSLLFWE